MLRTPLSMAACAAALLATPALAQETSPTPQDPAQTPPVQTAPQTTQTPETPPAQPTQQTDDAAPDAQPPAPTAEPEATEPEAEAETDATEQPAAEPADAAAQAAAEGDVLDVLRQRGQFTTFLGALEAAGLTGVIEADADITLLAPTDAAFAALPAGEMDRLMQPANRDALRQLLLFHIINADVRSEQLMNRRGAVETGSGAEVMIDGGGEALTFGGVAASESDVRGSNGAIFVLDRVLTPPAGTEAADDTDEAPAAAPAADETTGQETGEDAGEDAGEGADETPPSPAPTQPTDVPAQEAPTAPPAPATPPVQTPDATDEEETQPEA